MSNARILADLMGTSTTVPSSKLSLAGSDLPSGTVLQVKNTTFTGTSTTAYASSTNTKLTDLSVNITPTSTSSIIKIEAFVTGEYSNHASNYNMAWFFYRDNTAIVAPNAGSRNAGIQMGGNASYYSYDANSTPDNAAYMYFDSPSSTSQITYSVGLVSYYAGNWHLNRTVGDTDGVDFERGISTISVTEIAG